MNGEQEQAVEKKRSGFILSWLRAIGFYRGFLVVSFIPVSTGAMIAYRGGAKINLGWFGLSLLCVWFVHAATNLLNDYYDHVSGTDDINEVKTPFSGGTLVIQEGLLPDKRVRNAAWVLYVLGAVGLFFLGMNTGPLVWAFGAIGLLSGIFYTQKPVWLCYRGVGELMILVNFGPLLAAYSAYVHLGFVPVSAWLVGAALGLWTAAIITVNEVPDYEADKSVGKNNLVVLFGQEAGMLLWAALLWASVAVLFAGLLTGILPNRVVLATPIVFAVLLLTRKPMERIANLETIVEACRWTILSLIGYWVLLMVGFYLSPIVRLG